MEYRWTIVFIGPIKQTFSDRVPKGELRTFFHIARTTQRYPKTKQGSQSKDRRPGAAITSDFVQAIGSQNRLEH